MLCRRIRNHSTTYRCTITGFSQQEFYLQYNFSLPENANGHYCLSLLCLLGNEGMLLATTEGGWLGTGVVIDVATGCDEFMIVVMD